MMRIVVVEDWFSEKMGYAENCLPRALAALGHEVDMVTSDAQVYFDSPFYKEVYEPYLGPRVAAAGSKPLDGYTLHRLPHGSRRGRLRIRGLERMLVRLRPQIVQTFDAVAPSTCEAALLRPLLGYRLFTGQHTVASVFPVAELERMNWKGWALWWARVKGRGRAVSWASERCYAVTPDAAVIARRFYGVQERKVVVEPLGVDTDLFCPPATFAGRGEREKLRRELSFGPDEIVCIYTGRFTPAKNPACLGEAIGRLRAEGRPYRGLFIGTGLQEEALRGWAGCTVLPFRPASELPPYYRAADIGVWPMEESTSMLDALACGLPVVTNQQLHALDHLPGCWLGYRGGDAGDLARALAELRDSALRQTMGLAAAARIEEAYSWRAIAARRVQDYAAALGGAGR
jgi:glycosyltransferase involved in cell wall biosynthesis